ncbi:type I-E CRISPR-associated protein Cse2/CasB [Shewanella algae]|uniref:type I-E CRISPR-associated protein Cse2/CasB n=1 Tax=Shewanella algae TaxID=38313 RepID=UPI001AAD879A|nr:type I-E CRISPR-associated protein Cse2/CasB [Shewanella algae]MBO2592668.1 type I-E CRISPR-associated protein Cse2/CasB [Shewanella algae]MBO2676779.1 type I-E CRISPR-associated protein Cse2/CasB [Shewanella algae]
MSENYGLQEHGLQGADGTALRRWHTSLDEQRGMRAQLRRVDKPEEVLMTEAFAHFLQWVPASWRTEQQLMASALVAAILPWVKTDDVGRSFASQLKGHEERPLMSEMRFKQLLKSRTPEEFYRRLLRAVRLLDGKVNLLSLTADILQWYREFYQGPERNPVNRLAVKWARDYYAA